MLVSQISLFQNFTLSLQNFALLLQIFALLFGINCTEIDQSQSSIISVYIITTVKDKRLQNTNFPVCRQRRHDIE